jgi:hypothetical protein
MRKLFYTGLSEICPYIWVGPFLVTWGPRSPFDGVRWLRDMSISFRPEYNE